MTTKNIKLKKSKSNWESLYQLSCLLYIRDNRATYGRTEALAINKLLGQLSGRFQKVREDEIYHHKLQLANLMFPFVLDVYKDVKNNVIQEIDVVKCITAFVQSDEFSLEAYFSRCGIDFKEISKLSVSKKYITEVRGPARAVENKLSFMLGFSGNTLKNRNEYASATIAFTFGDAPKHIEENSKFNMVLAVEMLAKTFHLNEKKVKQVLKKLFVP